MSKNKYPFSVHHFFLAFKWDLITEAFNPSQNSVEHISFDKRTALLSDNLTRKRSFEKFLLDGNSIWKRVKFEIKKDSDYNQFVYFHKYARKVLFDHEQTNLRAETQLTYYEVDGLTEETPGSFEIAICGQQPYVLQLNGITLHAYQSGVGVLSFNLSNYSYALLSDVKRINEYGRRFFPQFLKETDDNTGQIQENVLAVKHAFLADEIKISFGNISIADNFTAYNDWQNISAASPVFAPKYFKNLFNGHFVFHSKDALVKKGEAGKVLVNKLFDDRMFTTCWYGNDGLARRVSKPRPDAKYGYLNSPTGSDWYSFVFCDKDAPTCQHDDLLEAEIKKHTYERWANYGTLFGITRDSFMVLSPSVEKLISIPAPRLDIHASTMYYQIAVLSLIQRSTLLRFASEISNLEDLAVKDPSELVEKVKVIHANYIEFVNKIYFREITSHIQGMELYEKMQNILNIESDVKDLDREIGELYNFVRLEEEKKQAEAAERLNKIAVFTIPFSLIVSVFGIGFIGENTPFVFGGPMDSKVGLALIFIGFASLLASFILYFIFIKQYHRKIFTSND